jgi:PAS domain S-box-containing protein
VQPTLRILVVGADEALREAFVAELRKAGHDVEGRPGPLDTDEDADIVLVAGGAPGSRRDGLGAIADGVTAARKAVGAAAVIACVPREESADAIDASLSSGADDVLVCPPRPGMLFARIGAVIKTAAARRGVERVERYGDVLVRIAAGFEVAFDAADGVTDMLSRVCEAIEWTRAVLVLAGEDASELFLVAASDDPSLIKTPLDPERYPEVRRALSLREPVFIEDARTSQVLGAWAELAATHGGRSLVAVPVMADRKAVGVLLVRSEEPRTLDASAHHFLKLAGLMLGLALQSGGLLVTFREQTRRMSKARFDQERRSRALEQYRDFFERTTDGMVALDAEGHVLYLNRAAEQLTGYAHSGLQGKPITDLVAAPQRAALLAVLRRVADGANLEAFDLQLGTTSGEMLTVSVLSSSVLSSYGCAILSFRDVSEARALENELRNTKEFLERLIDSTVDGIVAADLQGTVILFNQGAARLYGYRPQDVIGKLPVWKLYPDGVAQGIMAELRSPEHGGPGRLAPTRREIVTKDGERVPVSLAASMIYEQGREVATVGVVSDLRDRIKIEERLKAAQEKLVATEKQALIAELAGTTAHELNQPLTSVMGYAELLKKKLELESPHHRAVDIILREAERMAEIVRKIGRITRYETKAYVGSTQILDLDKSTTDG